jgi:homoserine O-acetyltransferase
VNCTMKFLMYAILAIAVISAPSHAQQNSQSFPTLEGNFLIHNFHFRSGEALPEIRMHYTTLGKPLRDAHGRTTNAVLILHGTTGSGHQFLTPSFAEVLFGPGQLLDFQRYYIILPDNLGHGESSKPSDGMHAHFPEYDYADMVAAQHNLVVEGLGVNHLRLVLGTSMGCMHSWMWGEMFPDEMDALMPLACLPVQIAGRNRMWRKLLMDAIREDPEWKGGDYISEPQAGLRAAMNLMLIAGSAPIAMQKTAPTRDAADQSVKRSREGNLKKIQTGEIDANNFWYAFNASRNYDPSPDLEKIKVPVMFVNSGDDFINPPELGIAEREIQRVKKGKFVLIPASEQTHGHGTHTAAVFWQQYLKELLAESQN